MSQSSNISELTGNITLIPKDSNSLFVIQNTKNKMTLSAYRKLIRQGMSDIGIDEMQKANKTYTELIVERAHEKDPSMDFLSTSQKIAMQKIYNKDPTAMPVKDVKPLRYNNADKFAAKIETDVNIIGNAAVESIKAIEDNKPHLAMFHLTNIVDLARDTRSETNLKRLEVRDPSSAVLIKRHTNGATIVSPAMQEVIKEEKNQGFKRQNYYYKNRNYRRNSFSGFSHGYDSSTYQLAQTIQKLSNNNQFFLNGGGDHRRIPSNPIPKQLPAYIPKKLTWKRKQSWLP
jgi:hypothetical protein